MSDGTQLFPAMARPAASLLVRELILDAREGPDSGKTFGPFLPPLRIGSARGNDLVLSDPTVSRFHCSVEREASGVILTDAGSTNGTYLGTERIRSAFLREGALIRLGQTALLVRLSREAKAVELSASGSFGALLGDSPPMRALFAVLIRLARAEAPVLIEGETGTGKDLAARAIHQASPRAGGPFVVVDCGAVAPSLVESELFGHARGAFTGADAARKGAFELADGGTIFLDEIGELPLALQPKLLRALESGTIKALGTAEDKVISVRALAATHRDLRAMVNEGRFREDLYFRLAVCPIKIPALRERLDDLPLLAEHFLAPALRAASPQIQQVPRLDRETVAFLEAQPWPGNVRELRNAIERAVILGEPAAVAAGQLAASLRQLGTVERRPSESAVGLEEAKRRFEREYLIRLMARHKGELGPAAGEADLHPKSLARLLRRHGIRRED
jgi:DNA-binding NtrC family response regulator